MSLTSNADNNEKNLNITSHQLNKYLLILKNVENGIYNEEEIRSLGMEGLKLCICEGKFEVFKTFPHFQLHIKNKIFC